MVKDQSSLEIAGIPRNLLKQEASLYRMQVKHWVQLQDD